MSMNKCRPAMYNVLGVAIVDRFERLEDINVPRRLAQHPARCALQSGK